MGIRTAGISLSIYVKINPANPANPAMLREALYLLGLTLPGFWKTLCRVFRNPAKPGKVF